MKLPIRSPYFLCDPGASFAQRSIGEDLLLRLAPPERVFALRSRDSSLTVPATSSIGAFGPAAERERGGCSAIGCLAHVRASLSGNSRCGAGPEPADLRRVVVVENSENETAGSCERSPVVSGEAFEG